MIRRFLAVAAPVIAAPVLLLGSFAAPVAAAGTTLFVDADGHAGPNDCNGSNSVPTHIQTAVNNAHKGDTIMVCPGTYVEDVVIKTSHLTLSAFDPWTAIVEPPSTHPANTPLIWIKRATGVTVKFFYLRQPTGGSCASVNYGLVGTSNAPYSQIRANHLDRDTSSGTGSCEYFVGIRVGQGSRHTTVAYNTMTDFLEEGIGVASPAVHVLHNTLNFYWANAGGGTSPAYGIFVQQDTHRAHISYNTIRGLSTAYSSSPALDRAISAVTGGDHVIKRNSIDYVSSGIVMLGPDNSIIRGNDIEHIVSGGDGNAILIQGGNNGVVENNTATSGTGGINVSGTDNYNIHDNNFDGHSFDCTDYTTGSRTAGTANTWTNDFGTYAYPSGICQPHT